MLRALRRDVLLGGVKVRSDERIEIFLARGLTHVGHAWDEGEFLEVLSLPLEVVEQRIHAGEITDAKTITALYRALPFLRRESAR